MCVFHVALGSPRQRTGQACPPPKPSPDPAPVPTPAALATLRPTPRCLPVPAPARCTGMVASLSLRCHSRAGPEHCFHGVFLPISAQTPAQRAAGHRLLPQPSAHSHRPRPLGIARQCPSGTLALRTRWAPLCPHRQGVPWRESPPRCGSSRPATGRCVKQRLSPGSCAVASRRQERRAGAGLAEEGEMAPRRKRRCFSARLRTRSSMKTHPSPASSLISRSLFEK